jgi:hypothetical protein
VRWERRVDLQRAGAIARRRALQRVQRVIRVCGARAQCWGVPLYCS